MKKDIDRLYIALFVIVALFLAFSCNAQGYRPRIAPLALSFAAGAAWGLHEKTAHHWDKFRQRFPNASWMFWNPAMSWKSKYVGGNPNNGRTKTPIWFTDAAHLIATINQTAIFGAGVTIAIGGHREWWHYAADAGLSFLAYSIGNELTFNWLYKK